MGSGDLNHRQQLLTPELEELRSNYDHQEAIMRRISDETTQEHNVAHMAFARLRQLIRWVAGTMTCPAARQIGAGHMWFPACGVLQLRDSSSKCLQLLLVARLIRA